MLGFLFRTLMAEPSRGAALFAAVSREARRPHWYVEGAIPDTLDGRFAVLATLTALALARIEQFGEDGDAASVALTERFVEVMETEHRELGIGDPTLGKTVRKLVGSLSRRLELWRSAVITDVEWHETTRASLYKGDVSSAAVEHSGRALGEFWARLLKTGLDALMEGRVA